MLKKLIIVCAALFMVAGMFILKNNSVNAEENDGCYVLFDGTIICEEDIPQGCEYDPEIRGIICEAEPWENRGDPGMKG